MYISCCNVGVVTTCGPGRGAAVYPARYTRLLSRSAGGIHSVLFAAGCFTDNELHDCSTQGVGKSYM